MTSKPMTASRLDRFRSESGVSLVHVALLLFVFMGFSMFVTDLGALWLARGQAQNAADSGALAGAIARAYDETANPPAVGGIVYQSAQAAVATHGVLGEAPTTDITMACPPYAAAGAICVRVDVFRDGTHSSATLPAFFGNVFGVNSQRIKATATAWAHDANHTNCLKPFMIPDKFEDVDGNGIYNMGDNYTAPGFTLADIGTWLTLRAGDPKDAAAPSTYYSTGDADEYRDNITMCRLEASPGDIVWMLPGRKQGPTESALGILLANGPVTLAIAMFSPVEWDANRNTGRYPMTIQNIMGFCVRPEDQTGSGIVGKICALPGDFDPNGPTGPATANFLKVIQLIQ
jgi:Putative Flp pilus-assembly TadE/G-like